MDCLHHERWRVLSELNTCIANAKIEDQIHFSFYQFTNPGINGFAMSKGTDSLAASNASATARSVAISACFQGLSADWKKCYCTELTCTSCPGNPDGGKRPDPPTKPPRKDDDPPPDSKDPQDGNVISNIKQITKSEYLLPIPLVYGSQLVYGNVIWIGSVRQNFTYKVTESTPDYGGSSFGASAAKQISVKAKKVEVATCDFAIGLCAGPINGIGRIWFGDKLVYDNRIAVVGGQATAPDGGALVGTVQDATKTGAASNDVSLTRTEIVLYRGTEEQTPPIPFGDGVGAVGYRGLAILLFKNYNLTANSGIPQIKVEVIHDVSSSTPYVEASLPQPFGAVAPYLTGINPGFLTVDYTSGVLVTAANGSAGNFLRKGFRAVDADTLVETGQCDPEFTLNLAVDFDFDSAFPLSPGIVCIQSDTGDTRTMRVIDVVKNSVLGTFDGVVNNARAQGSPSIAVDAVNQASGRSSFLLALPYEGGVEFYWQDKIDNAITLGGKFTGMEGQPTHAAVLTKTTDVTTAPKITSKLFYSTVAADKIRIYASLLKSTPSVIGFTPAAPSLVAELPSSIWGGDSAAVNIVGMFAVQTNGTLIIAVENNTEYQLLAYDPFALKIIWQTKVSSLPGFRFSYTNFNGLHWAFMGRDGFAYQVTLSTGAVENKGTLSAPTPVGPQHFNAADNSITYVSDTGSAKLTRLYIGRVVVRAQPIADVLVAMGERVGMEANDFDLAALSDMTLDGYVVASDATLRGILGQFKDYYPIEFSEFGGRITAATRGTDAAYYIPPDDSQGSEKDKPAVEITLVDRFTQVEFMTVAYMRADQGYSISRQTLKKPAFLGDSIDIPDTANVSLDYPFVLKDADAKAICERVVYEASVAPNKAQLVVGTRHGKIVPGMLVTTTKGDVTFSGLVNAVEQEPNERQRITITQAEPVIYNENATLAVDEDPLGKKPDDKLPAGRLHTPIVFPVPMPEGVDYTMSMTHTVPMLVAPRPTGVPIVSLKGYYSKNGIDTNFATYTKEVSLGILKTKPKFRSSIFTLDNESTVTIRFDAPPTLATATKLELLNSNTKNLLIVGKELIQFMDFSIAPDGKTVAFTNLMRGKRGTDYACDDHNIGELCAIYDPEAMKMLMMDFANFREAGVSIGFIEETDSILNLTYTTVPRSYYGIAAPTPMSLYRYASGFTGQYPAFKWHPRANVVYDLPDDGKNNAFDTQLSVSHDTVIYILRSPFNETQFRQYLRGENPTYVVASMGTADPYNPNPSESLAFFTDSLKAVTEAGIDLVVDELYVVIQSVNPEYNLTGGRGGALGSDLERERGFFEGYYFAKDDPRGIPYNLGKV